MPVLTIAELGEKAERSRKTIQRYMVAKFRVSMEDAEDLVSEAILRVVKSEKKNPGRFRGDAAVKTYLTKAAVNVKLERLRRKSHPTEELDANPTIALKARTPAHQYSDFAQSETTAILDAAIKKLSRKQSDVIHHVRNDATLEEIVQLTGRSMPAVKADKLRATRRLQELCAHPPATSPAPLHPGL